MGAKKNWGGEGSFLLTERIAAYGVDCKIVGKNASTPHRILLGNEREV